MLKELYESLDELQDIYNLIEQTIVDEPPIGVKDGGLIKLGYDEEIELSADYRPRNITRPEDVYESIANIENITPENIQHVNYARQLVKERKQNDFQRRF